MLFQQSRCTCDSRSCEAVAIYRDDIARRIDRLDVVCHNREGPVCQSAGISVGRDRSEVLIHADAEQEPVLVREVGAYHHFGFRPGEAVVPVPVRHRLDEEPIVRADMVHRGSVFSGILVTASPIEAHRDDESALIDRVAYRCRKDLSVDDSAALERPTRQYLLGAVGPYRENGGIVGHSVNTFAVLRRSSNRRNCGAMTNDITLAEIDCFGGTVPTSSEAEVHRLTVGRNPPCKLRLLLQVRAINDRDGHALAGDAAVVGVLSVHPHGGRTRTILRAARGRRCRGRRWSRCWSRRWAGRWSRCRGWCWRRNRRRAR